MIQEPGVTAYKYRMVRKWDASEIWELNLDDGNLEDDMEQYHNHRAIHQFSVSVREINRAFSVPRYSLTPICVFDLRTSICAFRTVLVFENESRCY